MQAMNIDALPLGRNQPFYHVLVDEQDRPRGSSTYVAQENINPLPPSVRVLPFFQLASTVGAVCCIHRCGSFLAGCRY